MADVRVRDPNRPTTGPKNRTDDDAHTPDRSRRLASRQEAELGRVKYGVSGTRCPRNSSWRSDEELVQHFIRNPESQADGPVRSVAYGCAEVGSTAKTAARTRSTIADA